MNDELDRDVLRRAAAHAALGDPARLRIADALADGDLAPSDLGTMLGIGSNLLAHHLRVLEEAGLIRRRRSEADRRRAYLHAVPAAEADDGAAPRRSARRVLFVCTGNTARSHLAAALWRRASAVPAASGGTHPGPRIHPGAIDAARRRRLPLPRLRPRHLEEVRQPGDLLITVCDRAHEELADPKAVHWSVPDPVETGDAAAFDAACADLSGRVARLAPRLSPLS